MASTGRSLHNFLNRRLYMHWIMKFRRVSWVWSSSMQCLKGMPISDQSDLVDGHHASRTSPSNFCIWGLFIHNKYDILKVRRRADSIYLHLHSRMILIHITAINRVPPPSRAQLAVLVQVYKCSKTMISLCSYMPQTHTHTHIYRHEKCTSSSRADSFFVSVYTMLKHPWR